MMDKDIKVSVVIPTYNRADIVKRAVSSVLDQTYQNFEVIIVNDGDDCGLYDYFLSLRDKRVKYTKNLRAKGGNGARNTGADIASGEYLAFLDDDDFWLPEKIELHLRSFLDSGGKGCSVCGYFDVPKDYCFSNIVLDKLSPSKNDVEITPVNIMKEKAKFGASSTIMVEKSYFYERGMFDETLMRHQDIELMIRFSAINEIHRCSNSLVLIPGHNKPSLQKSEDAKINYWKLIAPYLAKFDKKTINEIFAEEYRGLAIIAARDNYKLKTIYYVKKMLGCRIILNPEKYFWIVVYLLKNMFNFKK